MGPHPKPPFRSTTGRMKPKGPKGPSPATIAARKAAKQRELEKIKAAMRKPPPPPPQRGTHWHEEVLASPRATLDAQWLIDGGWSGKR